MERAEIARLNGFLAAHHGVASRDQVRSLGISIGQLDQLVRSGRWRAVRRGVYSPAGWGLGPAGELLAACLAAGAVASHASAAWLWGLRDPAPRRPAVTVRARNTRRLAGVDVHRSVDLDPSRVIEHRGIPVTDPLRTLADLGSSAPAGVLVEAVDRALARRLVTVPALEAEAGRLARRGRRGPGALAGELRRRGISGAPHPSVLESELGRLLRSWGVIPLGTEVVTCGGRYRVDVLLRQWVVLEADGFAYHSSPEAKAADSARRNALRLAGYTVIETDWITVMHGPGELRATVEWALGSRPAAAAG